MTPDQSQWLADHPKHEVFSPPPIVSTWSWTDHVYVLADGRELPEAPKRCFWAHPIKLFSAGDTLYVDQSYVHFARKSAIV